VPAVPPPSSDRLAAHQEQLLRLGLVRRKLGGAGTVSTLFANATELICRELRFDRGVILSVDGATLRADDTDALPTPASDRLRRQVLAAPISLTPSAYEAELIRLMRNPVSSQQHDTSLLSGALGLEHYAVAPIVVESRTLGILIVDRHTPAVDGLDIAAVGAFAEVVAAALESVVLRTRQRELATDLQNLTASTQALIKEMVDSPLTLPSGENRRPAFPLTGPVGAGAIDLRARLSEGESRIAALLVQGRSNREIAEELILSPETVKANVARILRKLGVTNRVAAATMIQRLSSPGG
jgi:DNA-binding CsgD family transcriptional regulator